MQRSEKKRSKRKSTRQLLATFLWRVMPSVLVEPPFASIRGDSVTVSRKAILEFLQQWQDKIYGNVLDVGVGNFAFTRTLLKNRCRYLAVDCEKGPNIDVVIDVARLTEKFGKNYCDFLICTDVLEHFENPHVAIDEFFNVLKPNGRLLLTVPFNYKLHYSADNPRARDYWRISADGLAILLKDFSDTVITPFGHKYFPHCYTVVARKP